MTKKRILSAALAAVMALSSLSVLSSCNKTEAEPVKEKRTNVYSGTEIPMPEGVNYINRLDYANGNAYFTYYKEYTITYNELGEEVERREGYYYQAGSNGMVEAMPYVDVPVEEVIVEETQTVVTEESEVETEAAEEEIIDADGDGIADATVEVQINKVAPALTAAAVVETEIEIVEEVVVTPELEKVMAAAEENPSEGDVLPEGWWYGYASVQMLCCISIESGEMTEIPLDIESQGYGYLRDFDITDDGMVTGTTNSWTYDEELGRSTSKYYFLSIDSTTGEVASAVLLSDAMTEAGIDMENTYINNAIAAPDGNYYIALETAIIVLDSDFKYLSQVTIDTGWINRIISIGDKIYVMYYNDGYKAKYLENGQLIDVESENLKAVFDNYYGIIGSSAEKIYYQMDSGVFAYDFATDTSAEILNYINSDIDSTNSTDMVAMEDGRILYAYTDWYAEESRTTLQVLEKVPDEMLSEEIIVRIGCTYSDYNLTRAIIRYNKQNTGVRIAVISYDQYNNEENEWKGAVQQLNNDIITGKVPDMIYLNSDLPIESYFQKGIFADLNEFIDDPENGINRDDYLTNIFEANSVDGKLYSMILSFSINTLVAKTAHVGTEPGWTFEEMMACINNMPEGMTAFFDWSRDDIVRNLFDVSMNSFVDWETGTTQFESQGFIDLIKYLSTCSEKGYWDAYYDSMGPDYVYDEEAERELSEKYELRFYKDYGLFNSSYVSSYTEMLYQMNQFASSDIVAIGYPTNDENANGSVIVPRMEFAISATSTAKDEAWEILKYFLTEEEAITSYGFSVKRSVNDEKYATASENYYYNEGSDEDYSWAREYGYSEDYITFMKESNRPFDQAGVDMVLDIIEGAGQISRTDEDLMEIITEELSTFFAGTRSAEETARIIASRASIYIAENS